MIWIAGRILPDEALAIPASDRTFEHGLGLFETFRTWGGRVRTLPRHCRRMIDSALALGLPAPRPDWLPDERAIAELREAEGWQDDCSLRLTMSGGSATTAPVVWLKSRPLPEPLPAEGVAIRASWSIAPDDPLASHKTLNYWRRGIAFEAAVEAGFADDLACDPTGRVVYEATRANLFLVHDDALHTPAASGAILPGIMRSVVLEQSATLGFRRVACNSDGLPVALLASAQELFLTNAGRGIIPVARCEFRETGSYPAARGYPAPGPWTGRLWAVVHQWLQEGATG